jgi:hypothetical protein
MQLSLRYGDDNGDGDDYYGDDDNGDGDDDDV